MTPIEKSYRDTVNRLAIALLFFEGLFLVVGGVTGFLSLFTVAMNAVAADVFTQLASGVMYCAVFLLPVLLFRLVSLGKPTVPMQTELRLSGDTLLYLFSGIAVITGAAYLNGYLVSIFDYGTFSEEVLWAQSTSANYQLILAFLTTAVIPAFVEEFLFRGLILSHLRPFGTTTAVVASALLFGMMHQNVEQLLYTTVAGLVLGYVYVKTESLWPCILMHFVNNFISVLRTALIERLSVESANLAIGVIQATFCVLGIVSAVVLMRRQRDGRRAALAMGCFERELPPHPDYVGEAIPLRRRVRLFFSAPMIVFFALCAVQMLLTLGLALLY
jgi:membrane protease YdiL (CAAX protease family)